MIILAISISYIDIVATMSLKISRILHAGYVIECTENGQTKKIAFDTIFENPFSRNCYAFPPVHFDEEKIRELKFDAVFISHFHDDHCSFESLNLLSRETPIYMFCVFEEIFDWIRELGFQNVFPLNLNVPVGIGAIEVIPRRALDADVDSILQVKAGGMNILNVVDAWIDHDTLELLANESPWDLVMWPFQTMRELEVIAPLRAEPAPDSIPGEWLAQLRILKPRYVIPSSCQFQMEPWSWYNHAFFPVTYARFAKEVQAALPAAQVVRLNPSASVYLTAQALASAEPLPWIQPVGEQNLDYDYWPKLPPPATAEIAKHFTPLSAEQKAAVLEYCRCGIIEKYQSLDEPESCYFSKARAWRLTIYDHYGQATHFFYRAQRSTLQLEKDVPESELGWTTEVPMAKLFGALAEGESLTSMYVRINGVTFASTIEREIAEADIVEDPLIRCLFNGVFGAYQRAQLKRLRGK